MFLVWSLLRQRPSADEQDTVTCLHSAGLALVNSILVQSIHRRDSRGEYCLLSTVSEYVVVVVVVVVFIQSCGHKTK